MCDLRVEDTVTAYTVLIDQSGTILAEVMENLHNVIGRQYLLQIKAQVMVKWINPEQIEDVTVFLEAELEQGDRFALDETFTVQA